MSKLSNVTLVTIETMYHDLANRALQECIDRLPFGQVLTLSDKELIKGATNIKIAPLPSLKDYCDILLKGLWPYVETDYILFVQWDAMVYNANGWDDDFLNYDYIGAPWPWKEDMHSVGNGGFSLRSRKLLHALRDHRIYLDKNAEHGVAEDNYIGIQHKQMLMDEYGIKYPSRKKAQRFAYELGEYPVEGSMGFHGFWNVVNFMNNDVVEYFVRNRPHTIFNEIHRAHHIIVSLAMRRMVEYIEMCAEDIRKSPVNLQLVQWLENEMFPNKIEILNKIRG